VSNDRNNIVDISGTLTNSPVTLNQNQDGIQSITNKHVEYVIDEGTVRVFPQKLLKNPEQED
jgi:DNA polymerase III sliding clamp (beta) subunit (PCNA family)